MACVVVLMVHVSMTADGAKFGANQKLFPDQIR